MASLVTPDGHVVAPLNIQAPAPILNLRGFQWDTVDDKIHGPVSHQVEHLVAQRDGSHAGGTPPGQGATPAPPLPPAATASLPAQLADQISLGKVPDPPAFPLTHFQGAYAGNGFNMIFRPRFGQDNSLPIPPNPAEVGPGDNILEVNLTTEQLTFGATIGKIPNRGLDGQPDITLGGLPYLQTVQDVTNPATGKGDSPQPNGIHFEPGMWLNVPPAAFQKGGIASVVRMASIPHGTTINAQGLVPNLVTTTTSGGVAGPPKIDAIDTTPFAFGNPSARFVGLFKSMDATQQKAFRIPQNLEKFNENGAKTITTAIIKNPNQVLVNALQGLDVRETITFEVSTGDPTDPNNAKAPLNGGGTANISFLAGFQEPTTTKAPGQGDNPIAHVPFMSATFWVETVAYKVTVPRLTTQTTLLLKPTMPVGSTAPTPEFAITTPPGGVPAVREIIVPGIQIQYSQTVNLNFKTLTWPHVSVATLVPTGPQTFKMT